MQRAILLSLLFCLSACVSSDYLGKTYPATTNVDLFFTMADVTQPYEVMGTIRAEAPEGVSMQTIQKKLVEDAKAKGADALVIEGMSKEVVGSSTNYSETESGGRSTGSSYTSTTRQEVVTGELLKYKK